MFLTDEDIDFVVDEALKNKDIGVLAIRHMFDIYDDTPPEQSNSWERSAARWPDPHWVDDLESR